MARVALRDTDEALDVVQDCMLTLARKYAHKRESEWAPLFHRILQNRIRDWHRRRKVRNRVMVVLGRGSTGHADWDETDPMARFPDRDSADPLRQLQLDAVSEVLAVEVEALPLRQQQAFMLRAWEGLDVAATAKAMRCSEGSVKTHYSRAIHRLREVLAAVHPERAEEQNDD